MRFNWFNQAFLRKLRHEKGKACAPRPFATAGNRPGLAHGGIESPSGNGRQVAGALQTRQARRRPNPQFRQRQGDGGKISEKEQGRPASEIN
jgi:hypothetical protein